MKLSDYDALLVLSFGGPEGKDEVIPFLENVTRGRGIPKERLATVGEHYFHFGGVSPINQQNRTLITNINAELERRGIKLPVYFGNRNWHPFAEDTAKQLAADGARYRVHSCGAPVTWDEGVAAQVLAGDLFLAEAVLRPSCSAPRCPRTPPSQRSTPLSQGRVK